MRRLTMEQVLASVHAIPALPDVVLDLIASMTNEDVDVDTLQRKIALDQVLSAKTLRLANSSFYGVQRQVRTVGEAVTVLGLRTVRSLATTAALVQTIPQDGGSAVDPRSYWRHSIGTALCARGLAAQCGQNPDFGYATGLLHDIGRLVLATRFPDSYRAALARRAIDDGFLVDAERAVLGLDHAQVGEAMARHWKFPEQMQAAVALHHDTDDPDTEVAVLLVHAADAIAHAMDFSADDEPVPVVQAAVWQRLGQDAHSLQNVLVQAQLHFDASCSVLA
jgi:putative nucleotidyltransferase with HDIG domain